MEHVKINILYLHWAKEITTITKMDTIFMNSENSKTSDPHRLLLNLTDKMNLKISNKYVALSNLSI